MTFPSPCPVLCWVYFRRGHQPKPPPWGCPSGGSDRYQGFPWQGGGCEWHRGRPDKVNLGAALLVSAAHFCGKSSLEMSICAGKGDAPNLGIAIRVCQGSLHVCAGRQTNSSSNIYKIMYSHRFSFISVITALPVPPGCPYPSTWMC